MLSISQAGSLLLFAPYTSMRTILTLPEDLKGIEECSVNGLLAAELAATQANTDPWTAVLAASTDLKDSLPIYWPSALQDLLPFGSRKLLDAQRSKIRRDWLAISPVLDSLTYEIFEFYWLSVSTRTFYYTSDEVETRYGALETDDCLAMIPHADYFNHASTGCTLRISEAGYEFVADRDLSGGEEVFFSYGNHNNDFLLVEYGFLIDSNPSDAIQLDEPVLSILTRAQEVILQEAGYLGNYLLDGDFCYRTIVAVRLLVMPLDAWSFSLLEGFEEDEYQHAVYRKLLEILWTSRWSTEQALQILQASGCRSSTHFNLLDRRLQQVQGIIDAAIEKTASAVGGDSIAL